MKEIIAIIRPKMVGPTKLALEKLDCPAITAIPVLGRGKQRGIIGEVDVEIRPKLIEQIKNSAMKYIPKRQISIVVKDEDVEPVVKAVIAVNRTGQYGDGKIFICPVVEAVRIRTDETGTDAIL